MYGVGDVLINKTLEVVYKEYYQAEAETVNWRFLRRLTYIPEDLPAERRRVLLGRAAWPIALVTEKSN